MRQKVTFGISSFQFRFLAMKPVVTNALYEVDLQDDMDYFETNTECSGQLEIRNYRKCHIFDFGIF